MRVSPVLRKEEVKLKYDDLRKLRDDNNAFKVEVQIVTTHTKDNEVFVVLSVRVNGLASIRSRLHLSSCNPEQVTHVTIGENIKNYVLKRY